MTETGGLPALIMSTPGEIVPAQPPKLRIACPTCNRPVVRSPERAAPFVPFCSERCKLVDLGKWFDGEHRIPGPPDERRSGAPGRQEDG
jgi:endogenous inhibitor of DNA gyrase (YacG/DUF329 family)